MRENARMRGWGRCALATAVVVGVSALVTAPPSGVVRACECALMSTVEMLSEQTAVVGGEVVGQWEDQSSTDGDFLVWRFRVDERWRGDTPEVIELQATAYGSSCGDPPTDLDGILLVSYQYPNGRYSVDPGCGPDVVSRDLVTYYFESPTPVTGRGPPAAVVAAEALGHNLVVVDAMGAPLRYLPGDGSTVAVAACPGGNNVVQLRAPSYPADIEQPVELVVWDTSEWVAGEPIEVMSAFERRFSVTIQEGFGVTEIAKVFGGRDHTTVMHAVRKIAALMKERKAVYDQVDEFTQRIADGE